MSLTTAIKTAMFAAIANARMLEDGLQQPDEAWSGVIGFMDGLQGDVAQLKLDMEAALASIRENGTNIDKLTGRLNVTEEDFSDLDKRMDENEVAIMEL